jgi:hypothetical protein
MQKYGLRKNFKYQKYFTLLLATVAVGAGTLLWYFSPRGYYNIITVTLGKYDYPFITTKLQNQDCELAIDIGCRFPLSLNQQVLEKIVDKQSQGTITIHNINGEKQEVPSYLIQQLKIGELSLKNVITHQSEEEYGTLGKFLGTDFNLLLDFPHSRIIACDSFTKLQAKKLADNNWIRVPIEMQKMGIVFHVDTDFGNCKLAINTTSTFSVLNSSLFPKEKSLISSALIFNKNHLGNLTFESIDLPKELDTIDGFIGMDFLKERAIYLDYTHKMAYIEPSKNYFECIPITFVSRNSPTIQTSIEGNTYSLELDLGSSFAFALSQDVLQNVRKFKYGTATWRDFKGREYQSPAYSIPEIKINNLKFSHVIAKQSNEDFHINTRIEGVPSQPIGIIGLPILEKYNLFLDFAHSIIYASKDHLLLQEAGLLSKNLLAVPFKVHPDGIFLSIETDNGTYRLKLDTGATYTAIRAPYPASTALFRMMGHDFGERSIKALDICSRFDFDGFLGMDFLHEYPIFIDYINKVVFIDIEKKHSALKL